MRRFLVYLGVLGFFSTFLTGCCCGGMLGSSEGHPHGICDCYQLSPCCTRQPWVSQIATPPVEVPQQLENKKL
jgi:hypothetical protein